MSDGPRRDRTSAGWFIRSIGVARNTIDVRQARWLVTLIGFNVATMHRLGSFIDILTGCQRFDPKNLTRCVCQLSGCGLMVSLLVNGHGLIALVLGTLSAEGSTGRLDYLIARRICLQLCISPALVRRTDIREVISVDGKTLLQGMSWAATDRTSGLMVSFFLGPATLSIYARQRALVMFATRLLVQFRCLFATISSILQAEDDRAAFRHVAGRGGRGGLATRPMPRLLSGRYPRSVGRVGD